MKYLMVGGPMDGTFVTMPQPYEVVQGPPDWGGRYVRVQITAKSLIYRFEPAIAPVPVRVNRWTKQKRPGGFPAHA